MASPVTYWPRVTTSYGRGPGSYSISKVRSKQVKPYNLPANYSHSRRTCARSDGDPGWDPSNGYSPWYLWLPNDVDENTPSVEYAIQRARRKFVDKLRERAAWGVNLVEGRQAMQMVADRLGQLTRFARNLRRGDLVGAAAALSISTAPTKRVPKKFANAFLEWHFGWSPLFDDIYTSCKILTEPFPSFEVRAKGKDHTLVSGSAISPGVWKNHGDQIWKTRSVVKASYAITNPNLSLLTQLGLTNPFTLAWEVVPFSFVVDWVLNISDFLGQFDEFFGLTLVNSSYTVKTDAFSSFSSQLYQPYPLPGYWGDPAFKDGYAKYFRRWVGIPGVSLGLSSARLSKSRAVTSVALLLQTLRG